jgi:hypothetical protein
MPDLKKQKFSPKILLANEHQFNEKMVCKLSVTPSEPIYCIHVHVKNAKGQIIGEVFINYLEQLNFSLEYSTNQSFLLYKDGKKTQNKVYIKFRFIKES